MFSFVIVSQNSFTVYLDALVSIFAREKPLHLATVH